MIYLVNFSVAVFVLVIAIILFKNKITMKEAIIQFAVQLLIVCIVGWASYHNDLADREILNSVVTNKTKDKVSCSHSYTCNCITRCSSTGKSGTSCSTHCQTCYEHSYDIDWNIHNEIGTSFTIDRIDRRGLDEPPRWTSVKAGDPTAQTHKYENYIKADAQSLFKKEFNEDQLKRFPKYPDKIYDYYKLNRVIQDKNYVNWQNDISLLNSRIGRVKQANLVVVLSSKSDSYADDLEIAWSGAKKNDIVLLLGTDGTNIGWARVIGIGVNEELKVFLRNNVVSYGKLDNGLLPIIENTIVEKFKRIPMSKFEYLKENYKPSKTAWIISLLITIACSVGLSYYFKETDNF